MVFASHDHDATGYNEYLGEMPWVALPYDQQGQAAVRELNEMFQVRSVPTLVLLGPDGSVVNASGRDAIAADPAGEQFPWLPPAASDLARGAAGRRCWLSVRRRRMRCGAV